jgi:hypothetical protein
MCILTAVDTMIIWIILLNIHNRKRASFFVRLAKNFDVLLTIIGSLIFCWKTYVDQKQQIFCTSLHFVAFLKRPNRAELVVPISCSSVLKSSIERFKNKSHRR